MKSCDEIYCYIGRMTTDMMELQKEVAEESAFLGLSSPFPLTAFYQQCEDVYRVSKPNIAASRNVHLASGQSNVKPHVQRIEPLFG